MPVTCKTCGEPTSFGPHCKPCQQKRDRLRNRAPSRQEYRTAEYLNFQPSGVCAICGKPGTPDDPLTRGHKIPTSLGGTAKDDGLQSEHLSCNSAKGNRE